MPRGEKVPDMAGDARVMRALLRLNGAALMPDDALPEFVAPGNRSSPDPWFARAAKAGATATVPPADMFRGDRYSQLTGSFGFAQSIGGFIREGSK